ncbi:hypothetical protein LCGC14_0806030 [marine sediment metagenome]|uniref:Uncharacterized protein n=1 Tax=marine sediment metagenome TaxID=412755 RepID=A0A0F9SVG0_9ZZZZ
MSKIKLQNQKIQKMRNYHYISIPKAYIDNGLLSTKKRYKVLLEEMREKTQEPNNSENQLETATEESS